MKLRDPNTLEEKDVAIGLRELSTRVQDSFYTTKRFSPEQRAAWDGFRENKWPPPKGCVTWMASGRAPYLHNGSVISLEQLLQPRSSRCEQFWAQPVPEFDPKAVGLSAVHDSTGICGTRSDVSEAKPVNTTVLGNQNRATKALSSAPIYRSRSVGNSSNTSSAFRDLKDRRAPCETSTTRVPARAGVWRRYAGYYPRYQRHGGEEDH